MGDADAERPGWTIRSLASRLGVSHPKVQRALERLGEAGIYDATRRKVVPSAAQEFVIHALRYVHPIAEGPLSRGVPTAWGAAPLSAVLTSEDPPPVWPSPGGRVRGPGIAQIEQAASALGR